MNMMHAINTFKTLPDKEIVSDTLKGRDLVLKLMHRGSLRTSEQAMFRWKIAKLKGYQVKKVDPKETKLKEAEKLFEVYNADEEELPEKEDISLKID